MGKTSGGDRQNLGGLLAMPLLRSIASGIRSLFQRKRVERDLDEELRGFMEMAAEESMKRGRSEKDAHRAVRLERGSVEAAKEVVRSAGWESFLETSWQDLRYGLRQLSHNPGFTAVAILTLALGIGANSAVFSAIDAILLRPLPFPDADQLMQISQYYLNGKNSNPFVAPVRLEDWNRMNSTFQAITGYYAEDDSEISGPLPEKVTIAFVAPRFLQVWGIAPALGRDFTTAEERFGGPGAVLISYRYWLRRFGRDPKAIGKKLRIGHFSLTIVGVMASSFLFPDRDVDLWSPEF